jgi:hypothetical protein
MVEPSLEGVLPGLRGQPYQITSPKERRYNCIAFAAGDDRNWWWPDAAGEDTWPAGVARTETVDAFRDAFATPGYVVCNDDQLEPGYEKVALSALAGVPKHAARQLPSGRRVSKLGPSEDIEHRLHDLTGMMQGDRIRLQSVLGKPPTGEVASGHDAVLQPEQAPQAAQESEG